MINSPQQNDFISPLYAYFVNIEHGHNIKNLPLCYINYIFTDVIDIKFATLQLS